MTKATGQAMVRRQLYVTARQDLIIRKLADRSGLTASEHYRRAIDSYINRATAAAEKSAAKQAEKETAAALGVAKPGIRESIRTKEEKAKAKKVQKKL